jgi:hypothetical protein
MTLTVRFQETLRRLAAIGGGFAEDGPGSHLARPRHRLLDPRTRAGCRWRSGRWRAERPLHARLPRLAEIELEPWPSNAGHSAINVRGVSPSLQALSAG